MQLAHMWLLDEPDGRNMKYSESKAGLVISMVTNPLLAVGMTGFLHLDIVSQIQMLSWMWLQPFLVVQTGQITTVSFHEYFSMWELGLIIIIIPMTYLMAV